MKVFNEIKLLEQMSKEKAEARKQGKVPTVGNAIAVTNEVEGTTEQMLNGTVRVVASATETTPVEVAPIAPTQTGMTPEQVQEMIANALGEMAGLQKENARLQAEINSWQEKAKISVQSVSDEKDKAIAEKEAEIAKREEAIASLTKEKTELEAVKAELSEHSKKLKEMGQLQGRVDFSSPQQMTVMGEGSDEMRRFERIVEQAPATRIATDKGMIIQKDLRGVRSYFKENQGRIAEGVEAVLKNAGWLQGSNVVTNASTVVGDIPSIAFTYLSQYIQENENPDYIYHQFANSSVAPGTPPHLNTAVPRYPNIIRPSSVASRQLTPGVGLTTDATPVTQVFSLITIEELGLGKDVNNRPIGLTEFAQAFSIHDLQQIVMSHLGYDYQAYNDLRLWTLFFGTDVIVYPSLNGSVVSNSATLTANDGVLSRAFFINLNAYFKNRQIPTFQGGCYAFMHTPSSWAQYVIQLTQQERFVDPDQKDLVTRAITQSTGKVGGEISGFKGVYDGWYHFMQNVHSIGNTPGTDPGVTSVTVASTPTTFESCFAFGRNTVAKATAMPVQIRQDEVTGFGRANRWIWIEFSGFGAINVKNNPSTGEELRVVQVRVKRQ